MGFESVINFKAGKIDTHKIKNCSEYNTKK